MIDEREVKRVDAVEKTGACVIARQTNYYVAVNTPAKLLRMHTIRAPREWSVFVLWLCVCLC